MKHENMCIGAVNILNGSLDKEDLKVKSQLKCLKLIDRS